METKKCNSCNEIKSLTSFSKHKDYIDGVRSQCKDCNKIYRQNNKNKIVERDKQYYSKNKERILKYNSEHHKEYYEKFPEKFLLKSAKRRATLFKLDFNLSLEDIKIPEFCPILNIPIFRNLGNKTACHNSPSIDRINPTKGYTKENIRVISHRANILKSNASLEEIKMILEDLQRVYNSQLVEVEEFNVSGDKRGSGGFGSTGG